MKFTNSPAAPAAIGPYSHAVSAHGFIFLSGQLGLDPQTMSLVEGLEAQTHQTFKNIQAVLSTLNKDLCHVVKTTIFLINMDDFAQVNIIYADYFKDHRPARSTIAVKQLPKNGLIEIECIVKE